MRESRNWAGLAVALTLAACSGDKKPAESTTAAPAAPVAPAGPAAAVAPVAPLAEADAVDAALAGAREFNAKTTEDLAAIGRSERRIHELAQRAFDLASRAGSASVSERPGLANRVAAARAEAEKAHAALIADVATFRTVSAEKSGLVDTALAQCMAVPELATYESCAALTAEQAPLKASIEALAKRFDAAEAAYARDLARLDEASAAVALAG